MRWRWLKKKKNLKGWEILTTCYTVLHRAPFLAVMELEITTKSTFSSVRYSSLYILKLLENSAAVCDNCQPAPEERLQSKWRMGGGGEMSCRRREGLKWEEDGHVKSLEKKRSFSLVSSGDTILSPLSCLRPLWHSGRFFPVCQANSPPSSSIRPPSSESIIRPSWRGVKNIMQKGPPSKKRTHVKPFLLVPSPH